HGVLPSKPALPGSGVGLLVRGHCGLLSLRLVQRLRGGAGETQGVETTGGSGGDALGERDLVRHRVERRVVGPVGKGVVHRRCGRDLLVERLGAEDLFDRADRRYLRVVGADHRAMLSPGADDLDRCAVAVDVVGSILAVVLEDEDGGVLPVLAVRDRVDDLALCKITVGNPGLRIRRPAGVVAGQPHHIEVGRTVLLEVLLPDLVAVDVRDRQVEGRGQRVGDVIQRRNHRAVVALQLRGAQLGRVTAALDTLARAVVLLPRTRRPALHVLELAVVLGGRAGGLDGGPEEPRALVPEDVLLGVVAALVLTRRRLGVLGIVTLHQPVMALSGVRADVVGVVVETELCGQRVLVRRGLLAKLRQGRVAVARSDVAEHLIVGAVLLDQQEDVLDGRRVTNARGNGCWRGFVARGLLDIVVSPTVLGEDGAGVLGNVLVARKREASQRCGGAVRVVAGHGNGSLSLVRRDAGTPCVNAAGVGDDDRTTDSGEGRGVVVRWQQAHVADRLLRLAVVAVDRNSIGTPQADEQVAVGGQGDAVRRVTDGGRRPRLSLDRLHDLVGGRVDDRDSVTVRVRDEQRVALAVHRGGVKAHSDRSDCRRRVRGVDDAYGSGFRGAKVA